MPAVEVDDGSASLCPRPSAEDGSSWSEALVLHEGPAGYSSLSWLPGTAELAVLFEAGDRFYAERVYFARVPIANLIGPHATSVASWGMG